MKIHCLQHVSFEGPGAIAEWADQHAYSLNYTRFYNNETLPSQLDFDLLVVMGGPMSFDDDEIFDWMPLEKAFIKEAIQAGKAAIGICLGAQFIAQALGAKAKRGTTQEVGWFPLEFSNQETTFPFLPETKTVFHWHGDTFDIPEKAIQLASTNDFPNQGFLWNKKVVGLQFHLEVTPASVKGMVDQVGHEIVPGTYCQTPEEINKDHKHYESNKHLLFQILDQITKE